MDSSFLATTTLSVLLVHGERDVAADLNAWLEQAAFRVRSVQSVDDARRAIVAECPNVLLVAGDLHDGRGAELCAWVRTQSLPGYVYTLVVSADADFQARLSALESGADAVLRLPVAREELLAQIRAGLRVRDLERRLVALAKCDSLTGLYAQRAFIEQLEKEWARSDRRQTPHLERPPALSCVMLDIDFFKRVNDTFGHASGDDVIRRVARILESCTRPGDIVSRYGGEEFCILLPNTSEQQAMQWAERVRREFARTDFAAGERSVRMTASFGVAQRLEDTRSPAELVDLADQALLVSKRAGRDRVTGFQSMGDSTDAASLFPSPAVEGLLARDVMTPIVASLQQSDRVSRAVDCFLQLRIQSAPVVDEVGRLVGVLSEQDAMSILLRPRWWEATVAEVMRNGVVVYEEDAPALEVHEFFCRVALRSVVVVKDGKPTGVIGRVSVLRWSANTQFAQAELEAERGARRSLEMAGEADRQLAGLAAALSQHSVRLAREIAARPADLALRIVGGVSRIQECASDLLNYSRFAGEAAPTDDGVTLTADSDTVQGIQAFLAHAASDSAL